MLRGTSNVLDVLLLLISLQNFEVEESDSDVVSNWMEGIFDSEFPWIQVFLRNINFSNKGHLGLYILSVPAPLRFDSLTALKFLVNVSFMFLKRLAITAPVNVFW